MTVFTFKFYCLRGRPGVQHVKFTIVNAYTKALQKHTLQQAERNNDFQEISTFYFCYDY